MSEALSEELEAVEAILMDGIELERDGRDRVTQMRVSLHPLTASDEEKMFVTLTLELLFPEKYPDEEPGIAVRTF